MKVVVQKYKHTNQFAPGRGVPSNRLNYHDLSRGQLNMEAWAMKIFYFLSKDKAKVKVTKPRDCKMKITILKGGKR